MDSSLNLALLKAVYSLPWSSSQVRAHIQGARPCLDTNPQQDLRHPSWFSKNIYFLQFQKAFGLTVGKKRRHRQMEIAGKNVSNSQLSYPTSTDLHLHLLRQTASSIIPAPSSPLPRSLEETRSPVCGMFGW